MEFTQDVAPYEVMKLSLLNASHTLLSYPSFLGGHRKVDEAMHDDRIVAFVSAFMDRDVTPYVPSPSGRNLEQYKRILIERFANSAVSDQVSRLCGDGASKFPVYVVPIMVQMLANEDDMTRIAYLMAAYRHYLKYKKDDNGDSFEIFEPKITAEDLGIIATDDPVSFLSITPFRDVDLLKSWLFEAKYVEFAERIKEEGAMAVLESIIR